MELRPMEPKDRSEVADLIHCSINVWYFMNGHPEIRFHGGPKVADVFYETYKDLNPDSHVVAVNEESGRIMGSCYFHPRETHVGLGIMNVHPNYFGERVGAALVDYITDFTDRGDYPALRLTSSGFNLDSFSLYTRAGFIPRHAYQDMWIAVPESGFGASPPGTERVREARVDDAPVMADLELELVGVRREMDWRYCIENKRGHWSVFVIESPAGELDGFLVSSGHQAMNIVGPGVIRTEADAIALIAKHVDLYRGRTPLGLIPVDKTDLVRQMYDWGARNSELHFCQVRGEFQAPKGVVMPTFMLETA